MKGLKIKAAIIAAFAIFAAFGTTAFAESSEETHEVTSDTSSSETTSNDSGADSDNSDGESTSSAPRVTDNPQLRAELQNDELYNYLMKYLNDPENFKADGTGVIIGESGINIPKPVTSDGESNPDYNYHTEDDNGEKVMYTVATRDGSIFYIVIDKSGETENVYFLNAVDAVDLVAVINRGKTESDTSYTPQEKEIINQAGKPVSNSNEGDTSDGEGGESGNSNTSKGDGENGNSESGDSSIILYVVIGVVAVAVIGVAAYKKVGPGKNKKAPAFDEEDDDEEYEEEEYVDDIDSSDDSSDE